MQTYTGPETFNFNTLSQKFISGNKLLCELKIKKIKILLTSFFLTTQIKLLNIINEMK